MRLSSIPPLGNDVAICHMDAGHLRRLVRCLDCCIEMVTSTAARESDSNLNLPQCAGSRMGIRSSIREEAMVVLVLRITPTAV
jgi:hypothetical protein